MILTIGYQRLSPERLREIITRLDARLIDCRNVPMSRRPGFSGRRLGELLGERYVQAGHFLGGRGHTTAEGIRWLRSQSGNVVLMCMEEAPGDCHRHFDICGPQFPEAVHIYQDELFTARALQQAEDDDSDYEIIGSLTELLENPETARNLLA